MNFRSYKEKILKKMGKKGAPFLHDIPTNGKFGRGMSIHDKGQRDYSDEKGHGLYKNQGLSKYIEAMEDAEKKGKFKFDTKR